MASVRKPPSQRQLRVGEQIRHILARELQRGDAIDPILFDATITVSEVSVAPNLRTATAYVMPLGGKNSEDILVALNESASYYSHLVAKKLTTKFSPKLKFELDTSFDEADKIGALLRK